jgi:hypothetical protein
MMRRKLTGTLNFAGRPKVGSRGVFYPRNGDIIVVSITTKWLGRDRFTFEGQYRGRLWRGTGSPGTHVSLRTVHA